MGREEAVAERSGPSRRVGLRPGSSFLAALRNDGARYRPSTRRRNPLATCLIRLSKGARVVVVRLALPKDSLKSAAHLGKEQVMAGEPRSNGVIRVELKRV